MARENGEGQPQDLIALAFQRGSDLRDAKGSLYEQMAANRRMLRDLRTQGLLTEEQASAVDELYPPKAARAAAVSE